MESVTLHGPLAAGSTVTMTPKGQDPVTSVITGVEENKRYADRAEFGGVTLSFSHTRTGLPGGATRVTHRLEITGDEAVARHAPLAAGGRGGTRPVRPDPRPVRPAVVRLVAERPRRGSQPASARPPGRHRREDDLPGHPQARGKGLIVRETDRDDTRAKRLRITEAGTALALTAIGRRSGRMPRSSVRSPAPAPRRRKSPACSAAWPSDPGPGVTRARRYPRLSPPGASAVSGVVAPGAGAWAAVARAAGSGRVRHTTAQ
jgi:hypothetical protein